MPIRFQFILLIAALLLFSNEATVNKILVSSKKHYHLRIHQVMVIHSGRGFLWKFFDIVLQTIL